MRNPTPERRKIVSSTGRIAHNSRGSSRDSANRKQKLGSELNKPSRKRGPSHVEYFNRKPGEIGFKIHVKKPTWTRERVRSEQGQTFYIPPELWPRVLNQRLDISKAYAKFQEDEAYYEDLLGKAKYPAADSTHVPIEDLKPFYAWCGIFIAAKYNSSYRKQIRIVMNNAEAKAELKKLMENDTHWKVTAWQPRNRIFAKEIHINEKDKAVVRNVTFYEEPLFKC